MFRNFHQAAFALITDPFGRVLFKLRRDLPLWDLPGGKADLEDYSEGLWLPKTTCQREVFEETGCGIEIVRTFGYFFTAAISHGILSISVVFVAQVTEGQLCHNEEAENFGWFSHSSLPAQTFAIHADILRQFQKGKIDNPDLRHLVYEQRRALQ